MERRTLDKLFNVKITIIREDDSEIEYGQFVIYRDNDKEAKEEIHKMFQMCYSWPQMAYLGAIKEIKTEIVEFSYEDKIDHLIGIFMNESP